MTYSLVSAATLGFDLVRLRAGRQVAHVLLTGLAAGAADLEALAAEHPRHATDADGADGAAGRSRRAREAAASATPRLSNLSGLVAGAQAADGAGGDPSQRLAVLLARLESGMIGGVPGLEHLVAADVLEPAAFPGVPDAVRTDAAEVLAGAAVAAYAAEHLTSELRRELSAAFRAASPRLAPAQHDLGPAADRLWALLADVRDLDGSGRARWRAVVDTVRERRRPWSAAMHDASWAAHVSGRLRVVAAAQLLAVQAFDDAGLDAADGARGVWNALAGCVQGLAVADLLDDASLEVLLEPWALVTGTSLLR